MSMRPDDGERLCQEAQVYYYDLTSQDEAAVPDAVRRHVAACPACQEQVRRLREILLEAEQGPHPTRTRDGETIAALARQFQLLDEHVACSDVKPFLPKLAMALPQIRIPTPVTVHVDHCPRCADDLDALREMDLTTGQLKRLSELFESPRGGGLPPLQAPFRAQPGGWGPPHGTEVQGQGALATGAPIQGAGIACDDISNADLFDNIVPGADPPDARHRAVASHLGACPACRTRAQTLHDTVFTMLKRADSETTTIYHTGSDTEDTLKEMEASYPYPIDVQVLLNRKRGHLALSPGFEGLPARHAARKKAEGPLFRARPLAKAAVVAFALAALLLLRWTNAPTASGTDVDDLLQPLAKAQNVHIRTTTAFNELTHETLIACRSNRIVVWTPQRGILYDLDRGLIRTIEAGGQAGPARKMSRADYDAARELMANRLQGTMARLSPHARLRKQTGIFGPVAEKNLDVYETTWVRRGTGPVLYSGWRAYLDRATGLPQRTEFYQQRLGDPPGTTSWVLATTTVFTYPTEQEMDSRIEALFPAP
jgi:hypothetical protein